MIKEIKQAILLRLVPLRTSARIIADDSGGEAGGNAQVKSDYIIRASYSGGTFTPPVTQSGFSNQESTRNFEISVEIKDLRSEDEATDLMEKIEDLIAGFRPCTRGVQGEFYLASDRFVQNKDGVYFYAITVSISTIKY